MTVQTLEELRALPVGSIIHVDQDSIGSTEWTRSEQGFTADDRMLLPELFVGYAALGHVRVLDNTVPRAGEWWNDRHYFYFVESVTETNARALVIRPDLLAPIVLVDTQPLSSFRQRTRLDTAAVAPVLTVPVVQAMAAEILRLSNDVNQRMDEVRVLKRRPEPERVAADLRELRARIDTMISTVGGD